MEQYHLRRMELAIKTEAEMIKVVKSQRFLTIAMCTQDRPYLVSLNYSYDPVEKSFLFHCARSGRKIDILSANPFVWGQVVEDIGYVEGECEYGYRSVMFEGKVTFLDDPDEKRKALEAMVEGYEPGSDEAKSELIKQNSLEKVCVGKIQVLSMSGKESIPKKK